MKGRLTPIAALVCALVAAGSVLADPQEHGRGRDGDRRGGWGGEERGRGEDRGRGGPPVYSPREDPRYEGRGRGDAPRYDGYGRYAPPPIRGPIYVPPPAPYGDYDRGRNSLGADWGEQQDEARRGVSQGRILPLKRLL